MPSLRSGRFEHGGNVYAHPGCVDFSANLNPLGMPDSARSALREGVDSFALYPDPECTELVRALASFEGVPREWVLPCAGATDAFARVCAVVRPRNALVFSPCYSGYEQALEQVGAHACHYALKEADDFSLPAASFSKREYPFFKKGVPLFEKGGGGLVFVANPNNPTGRCVEREAMIACLEYAQEWDAHVVVDECFIDLTKHEGSNDLLERFPNMVLVKAFTKCFALAGVRLGYVLCTDTAFLDRLRAAGQTWAVSVPAQIAGVACAAEKPFLERSRQLIATERERLVRSLNGHGLHVVPSEANYVLFRGPQGLKQALFSHGILIRSCDNYYGLSDSWYRIAVRTPNQNDLLIKTLVEVLP